MLIFGAMAIPCLVAIVLFIWFRHQTCWWEFAIPFGVSLVFIGVAQYVGDDIYASDIEYRGGWATQAEYHEPWSEKVGCAHMIYCSRPVTRSINGRMSVSVESYICGRSHGFDIRSHPPAWVLFDSNGGSQQIQQEDFETLADKWKNLARLNLGHKNVQVTTWDGKNDTTIVPVTTQHEYANRVQTRFENVDPEVFGLYEYPKIGKWDQQAILGNGGSDTHAADAFLRFWNAKYGAEKNVRMMILLFPESSTIETGIAQEHFWKRGNGNEFVLALGINRNKKVTWAHVISWTDQETLKTDVEMFVLEQSTLDLMSLANYLVSQVYERFEVRSLENGSFLSTQTPVWYVALSYLVTLLVNIGISWWIISNSHKK